MVVAQLCDKLTSLYVCVYYHVENGPPKCHFLIQINPIYISIYVLRSSLILKGADKMDQAMKLIYLGNNHF